MQIKQIVFSKCGRDKGRAYVITDIQGDYVFLVDGKLRPLSKPKKKKAKHIQITNTCFEGGLNDVDIRKKLLPFKRR